MKESKITYIPKGMLRRKFVPPALPAYHVPERTMTSQIMDVDLWRICLIHAKGGMGKTTLLSQWHADFSAQDDWSALWVSLESRDAAGTSFARVLATLFQEVDGRFSDLARSFEGEDDSSMMLVDIINLLDVACDPAKTYFLILDDYDKASSGDLDAALVFLNKNLADNWRIVVAGSFLSSNLDDLLLDALVLEFRSGDLSFDEGRLHELAASILPWMGVDDLKELKEASAGWPLALVFASLAHKRAEYTEEAAQITSSYLGRYFAKEVLDRLDEEEHEFVRDVCLLDTMPVELCDAIAQTHRSKPILDSFVARNLFTRRDRNGEYVFDPLFHMILRDELLSMTDERLVRTAKLASVWYERAGRFDEGVKYVALTCEPVFLEDTAFYSTSHHYPSSYRDLADYLLKCPACKWGDDAYLTWVGIWAYISSGMVERAREMMAHARRFEGDTVTHAFQYADALCLALEGRSRESYDAVSSLLESESYEMPKEFRCLFLHMQGEDSERLGHIRESRDLYMRALSLAEQMKGSFYKLFDMYLLSRHFLYFDDFDKARDYAERIVSAADPQSPIWSAAQACIAYIHMERGELDWAREHLEAMNRGSSDEMNLDMHIDITVERARYLWVSGDAIGALSMMQDLVMRLAGSKVSVPRNAQFEAYSSLALMAAQAGDLVALHPYVEKLEEGSRLPDLARAIPCMTALAACTWASGSADEAHGLMDEVRERIEESECSGTYWVTKTLVIESAWLAEESRRAAGAAMLSRAISLAMRNGYMSVFLLGGAHVKTMLLEVVTNRKTPSAVKSYARRILSLFGDDAAIEEDLALSKGAVQGYYSLTEREREILHLLNSGMSRQELSEHLVISQNTAKTHLKKIYAKLGVHTRAEAYRITREHERDFSAQGISADALDAEGQSPASPAE